jgi:hypothetical protein
MREEVCVMLLTGFVRTIPYGAARCEPSIREAAGLVCAAEGWCQRLELSGRLHPGRVTGPGIHSALFVHTFDDHAT